MRFLSAFELKSAVLFRPLILAAEAVKKRARNPGRKLNEKQNYKLAILLMIFSSCDAGNILRLEALSSLC
ncbi:hypothetical protein HMPREF0201_02124 [Cedecea davisae DSM 4568]|uniref:Uncharacterized protein n=1 Tax=Cedecea davisae DSM 4568 TaxID=566551 RepID=S3JUR0_9ENTR|nr:hypothetical protein HMPREF0201_02124 [Cedecea davisae DSM 4568]